MIYIANMKIIMANIVAIKNIEAILSYCKFPLTIFSNENVHTHNIFVYYVYIISILLYV
jgi:hypothetical protein